MTWSNSIDQERNVILTTAKGTLMGLLVAGLVLTGVVAHYAKRDAEDGAQRRFDKVSDEIRLGLLARLRACAQVLHSGVGLFAASSAVERGEWRAFTQSLQLSQQLPGIQGVGFTQLIPRAQLAEHERAIRREGFPEYQVRPAGDRETYSAIIFLEPFTQRNLRAFGYDMYSEPVRRAAMERARDEHAAALSGKVILVQETDEEVQAGTLMFVPVYQQGMPQETTAQRRAALQGWVYSPYRMGDLVRGTLRDWKMEPKEHQLGLQIFDGEVLTAENLLFDNQASAGSGLPPTQVTRLAHLDYAGRRWTLRFSQPGGLAATADYSTAWLALFGGTTISLLVFWLALSLMGTRANAQRLAERLTTALRSSEESYRNQFAKNSAVMLLVDPATGALLDANAAAVSFYGYPREQLLGLRISDINTLPAAEIRQAMASVVPEQGSHFTFQHRLASGSLRDVEVASSRIEFGGRSVLNSIVQEVTERKRVEKENKRQADELRLIMGTISVGVSFVRDLHVQSANLAHDRIFGFDRGGTAGLATAAFYASPVEFQRVGEEGYRALARGEIFHTEAEMRRQDGSPFLAKLIGQAIDPQDPGAGSIWQVEDITEQIAQRRKLLELLRQTEHDARMKGQLLREVNHRVTNNLTSVLGLIVLEQERAPAGDRERVAPSLDRLQQSIRGLLTVHRMLAQSAWAPVNLTHLAREIIRAALNAAPWRNQAVVTIEASDLRVSPRQAGGVALIFNELATNSVKYARPDSRPVTLSVTFAATPGWITICYRDNGPGYAADVIESQRANMGLKLIQDVVATTLGGTVELENENGAKTTVRMQPEMETRT